VSCHLVVANACQTLLYALLCPTLAANANIGALTFNPVISNLGLLSYQWKRGTINIGNNNANYTLTQEDIGNTITVTVTAIYCNGSITSNPTAVITKPSTLPTCLLLSVMFA
jgi:hypothetical protein